MIDMKYFQADSSAFITCAGSTDHSIKKWNMRTGALLKSFRGHSASVICLQVSGQRGY